jgi:hypothetical protein
VLAGLSLSPSSFVLGHDGMDAARHRIGFNILRPIHRCGAQRIGRKARLEQHLGLGGKALVRRERAFAMHQRQPVHRAIGIDLGDREHAVIENVFARAGLPDRRRRPVIPDCTPTAH